MKADTVRELAGLFPTHWERHYAAAKMKTDPLYPAVERELNGTALPLLDIGCGIGLLALYLRASQHAYPILGFDYDERKIVSARSATLSSDQSAISFEVGDARCNLPDHRGNVTILDILQFFTPDEQQRLLQAAAERVPHGGKLVIRSTIRTASWRYRTTVCGDFIAKFSFWMKAAPTHYPTREDFARALEDYGSLTIRPLWGRTPFNNHLIVLERRV